MTNQPVFTNLYGTAIGSQSTNAFVDHFDTRDPTVNDVQFPVQKKWYNISNNAYWILVGFVTTNGIITADWEVITSGVVFETLTGNIGPVVPPSSNNINVVGDGTFVTTTGNAGTSTLTISVTGAITQLYQTDSGTATPTAGTLNVLGGTGTSTAGSGNTITITASATALAYVSVNHAASPYTVLSSDDFISCDTSTGTITIELPNAPVMSKVYIIKDRAGDAATSNITITTVGGIITIDGSTSYVINTNFEAINVIFNGTNYEVW